MPIIRRLRHSALTAAAALALAAPAVALAAPAGCAGPPSDTWINVVLENVRSSKGGIAVMLYPDDSGRFLAKGGTLYGVHIPAQAGTTRGCMFLPRPGVYAIAIYHDEDGNHKFKRSAIGLPAEGYGFANNPVTIAGLPSFRSVRLAAPKTGLVTRITVKYP
jgi:uncharacterized protein (DUF2141 family)